MNDPFPFNLELNYFNYINIIEDGDHSKSLRN